MSDQDSSSGGLKRQLVKGLLRQKKPFFQSWFKLLLLFCLVLFVLCYTLSQSSRSWWENFPLQEHYERFVNLTNRFHLRAPGGIEPSDILVRTESPTALPNASSAVPPTAPPAVPPTAPPAVPPTAPPAVPPTVPPTAPPTVFQYHQAYARNYHFVMDNTEICKTKTPFLVLMVPVAPGNTAARDAIRQTWAKESLVQGEVVITLFMLGLSGGGVKELQEKLKEENLQHHDLILSDFMDTYLNLTIKTMVIMDWLDTRCPTAAYAMKIDSDMFLNIDNLVIMLKKPGIPKQNYLTGMLMWDRPVVRFKLSKWYVSEELFPDPRYPTYALGMGYVFSNDLPGKFLEASKSIKPFNIEDAYIGMCMKKLGLSLTEPPDPSQFKAYSRGFNRCEYSKLITYILGSAEELVKYWTDLKKPGPPC